METEISQAVQDAGQKIATAPGSLADALNDALNQLLPWPFRATKGAVRETAGNITPVPPLPLTLYSSLMLLIQTV